MMLISGLDLPGAPFAIVSWRWRTSDLRIVTSRSLFHLLITGAVEHSNTWILVVIVHNNLLNVLIAGF